MSFALCSVAPAHAETKPTASRDRCPPGSELDDRSAHQLRALLAARRYADLEKRIDRYQNAYERHVSCEPVLWEAFGALDTLTRERNAQFGAWVAARPDSWAAYTARGMLFVEFVARLRRVQANPDRARARKEAFADARKDLDRAVALRRRGVVAYGGLVRLLGVSEMQAKALQVADRLLAIDPLNYGVRRRLCEALDPSLGGSLAKMEEVAHRAQAYVHRNPRLRVLLGFPLASRAAAASRAGQKRAALELYDRALRFGEFDPWLYARVELDDELGQYADAVRDANAALDLLPGSLFALELRARAYSDLGREKPALRDIDRIIKAFGPAPYYIRLRGWIYARGGESGKAIRDYRAVLEAWPRDAWTRQQLDRLLAQNRPLRRPELPARYLSPQ